MNFSGSIDRNTYSVVPSITNGNVKRAVTFNSQKQRHVTQHNDNQHNDNQHSDTQHNI
jgi:hypothetical protein